MTWEKAQCRCHFSVPQCVSFQQGRLKDRRRHEVWDCKHLRTCPLIGLDVDVDSWQEFTGAVRQKRNTRSFHIVFFTAWWPNFASERLVKSCISSYDLVMWFLSCHRHRPIQIQRDQGPHILIKGCEWHNVSITWRIRYFVVATLGNPISHRNTWKLKSCILLRFCLWLCLIFLKD